MAPHPPALEYALRCSNWNTRGWTFQERHLSRRCIYFSSDFVYFQCGESTRCETGGDLLPWLDITPTTGYSSRAEALRKVEMNPLLYLPTCASPDPLSFQENPNPVDHYVYKRHRFDVYQEIVEAYSRRQLSFVADALNAFAGVGRVLERAFDCSILSGLPTCYLDHALIWAHEGSWTRRVLPDSSHNNRDGLSTKVFPSWSWAGWTGSMQYLLLTKGENTYRRENHEYARSEIECFQIFHSGELHEIFKDKARMNAVLTRNLGSYSQKPILKTYPIYLGYEERKTQGIQGPDFGPDALQFWTEAVRDDAFTLTQLGHGHLIADREHGNVVGEQGVIKMLDGAKTHCGLMLSFHSKDTRTWHKPTRGRLEWILVSSFGDAHDRRSGLKTVDTEVRLFDERKLPYKGPGSGLVNVMLIEWDDEVAERLTVAQVHRQAWEAAGPERKHIRLI
ncbi:hypothetical protein C8A01DRAFT_50888 [Parachaetomium inaequale]|uniref:Heterokaryon incompatibility domain-containing protein n=1 Tax=Parachaetomium inaequale TaxID=2588326 RepID=A0AAN6P5S8_9PEZI|nr:hypothetical protein C8A01DRAFT_50888 [Parachaetomium inaequale]